MLALLFCAFSHAAVAIASPPPRPLDGTYVYRATYNGLDIADDTIVVSADAEGVHVRDAANIQIQNVSAIATSTYDPLTLSQTGYSADFTLPNGKQHTDVTFAPGVVTVNVPGESVPIKADPSAPLEFTGDNLAGSFFMLLAALHAHGATLFTLARLEGGVAVPSHIAPATNAARPAGVPTRDAATTVAFGQSAQTFWYDPATFVVDAVESPAQGLEIRLTSKRVGVVTAATPQPVETPEPTPFPHFTSTDVTFASSDGTQLAGTVTVPDGARHRLPAVVLVHGSGAQDRNEDIGPNAVFLQLSNALSNAGYVVLRYDKRGIGRSGGNAATTTRGELLADVRAATAFVRLLPAVDAHRVFLIGHSEGGELVPSVAANDRSIAGIVLMAGPALPLWQISLEQVLEGTPAAQRAAARREELAQLQQIREGKLHVGGPWYRTSMDVDPAVDIERVRAPILMLQGLSDVEVLPRDLPRLVRAARSHNHNVTVATFPGDNHLFMKVTPGEPLTPQAAVHQYLAVASSIDPAVLRTIIRWLNGVAAPHSATRS